MLSWLLVSLVHADEVLPVSRIRFYETGVAYFEREGRVAESTRLPVPRAHLDDALKTLVVLGADAEVGVVSFPSSMSDRAARVMAGLGDTSGQSVGFDEALQALEGAEVEITGRDGSHQGILLDVSGPLPRAKEAELDTAQVLPPEFALTLLATDGSLVRTTTDALTSVRPRGADVTARLHQAGLTAADGSARQTNQLSVQMWESGPLALGYLAETPVWRVSYRLVIDGSGQSTLQAWALIHNDTDEAWEDVQVELANGRPDSFLYPMATPRYGERPLVTPTEQLSSVPQLATETADEMWDDGQGGFGMSGIGMGGGGSSFGSAGLGTVGVSRGASMDLARLKQAEPVETPTQFIYRVPHPLDLAAHHSALVPLIHGEISAERAVVFPHDGSGARNGVWVTNDTARTLPTGVASVFEAGGLAGESAIDRLKPEENQMVLFGTELDVEVERRTDRGPLQIRSLAFADRMLEVEEVSPSSLTVELKNRTGAERAVWLGLALDPETDIQGEVRTEIDPADGGTFAVLHAAAGTSEQTLELERAVTARLPPWSYSEGDFLEWADAQLADPAVLRKAAQARGQLAAIESDLHASNDELNARNQELTRLREDMRAASDGGSVLARRAAGVEQDIRRLEGVIDRLTAKQAEQRERLLEALAPLEPEEPVALAD